MPYNRKKKETKKSTLTYKIQDYSKPLGELQTTRHIVCFTQKSNHIPFPLCLWSNQQTNHVRETWLYVSRRALESEHASQFYTNQSIAARSVSASNKKVNFVKVLSGYQISKGKKKKKVWWAYKTLTRIGCFFLTFCYFEQLSTQKATFDFNEQFVEIPIRRYNLYASGPWLKGLFI